MVSFGCHAFVLIGSWDTDSGNRAIRMIGEYGFDVIEIPLLKPAEFDAASHRAALAQAGLRAVCSLTLPRELHMPENPEGARAFLIDALDKTAEVGSSFLGGCIAYSLGRLTGAPPTDAERQTVIDVLRDLAGEAAKRGITLALEACNRYETYMYNTLEDVRSTIRAVGADNLVLHADTYHMNIEEEGFYTPIVNAADALAYIHMSESHRGLLGSGTVSWEQVWRGLAEIGYSGTLTLESFAAINPDLAAATCLWRPPRQPAEVIARDGLAFLKAGAAQAGLM
jgi:D-psicose/D-tagatose/L-ribulose 3-epimerase